LWKNYQDNMMTRKYSFGFALFCVLALASCDYQKNNTIKQKDVREGDTYVYGVHPDSAAWQLKNKYTEKPETALRAEAIRQKMFQDKKIAQGN
jgi:hypothetical protein